MAERTRRQRGGGTQNTLVTPQLKANTDLASRRITQNRHISIFSGVHTKNTEWTLRWNVSVPTCPTKNILPSTSYSYFNTWTDGSRGCIGKACNSGAIPARFECGWARRGTTALAWETRRTRTPWSSAKIPVGNCWVCRVQLSETKT